MKITNYQKQAFIDYLRNGISYPKMVKNILIYLIEAYKYQFRDLINIRVIDVIPRVIWFILVVCFTVCCFVYFVTLLPLKYLKQVYLYRNCVKIFKEHGFYKMIEKFNNNEFNVI